MKEKKADDFIGKNLSNTKDNVWYYSGAITAHVLYTEDTENMATQEKTYEGS